MAFVGSIGSVVVVVFVCAHSVQLAVVKNQVDNKQATASSVHHASCPDFQSSGAVDSTHCTGVIELSQPCRTWQLC